MEISGSIPNPLLLRVVIIEPEQLKQNNVEAVLGAINEIEYKYAKLHYTTPSRITNSIINQLRILGMKKNEGEYEVRGLYRNRQKLVFLIDNFEVKVFHQW